MAKMRRASVVFFDCLFNRRGYGLNAAEYDWHNHIARIQASRINAHWRSRPNCHKLFGVLFDQFFNVRQHHYSLIRPIAKYATNEVRNYNRFAGSGRHGDDRISDVSALEVVEY